MSHAVTFEKLTRAELQGVVAHEFSHILYGDARLNLRLMGILYGMVSVHMFGNHLINGYQPTRGREAGRSLAAIGVKRPRRVTSFSTT